MLGQSLALRNNNTSLSDVVVAGDTSAIGNIDPTCSGINNVQMGMWTVEMHYMQ